MSSSVPVFLFPYSIGGFWIIQAKYDDILSSEELSVGVQSNVLLYRTSAGKDLPDGRILKSDVTIAKNYLSEKEISSLSKVLF